MKIIQKLSDYIEEEIEDSNKYIDCALKYKEDNPMLAKVFYDISMGEMNHMSALHDEVVRAINEYRQTNGDVPADMKAIYDYLHERHVENANDVKLKQMQYKNS